VANEQTKKVRQAIIAKISTVPGMPSSSARIIGMLQDPEIEISDLVAALEYDPGLTANLLRWANSAYFGGRHEILSVRDAVVRLGMRRMNQLIMTSIAAPVVGQPIRGYDLAPGRLLEHSIAVAIGTGELAKALRIPAPEMAFTAGLLHDIGKVVLGMFVEIASEPILAMAREEGIPFDAAEREVLGIDHAEVGALLLERWNLPGSIVSAVRWHHQPHRKPDDPVTVDLVHTMEALSLSCGMGSGVDGLFYQPDPIVVERLGLTARATELAISRMLAGLAEIRPLITPENEAAIA
jgi:putative nucleotidyltransferase with HDIG domain